MDIKPSPSISKGDSITVASEIRPKSKSVVDRFFYKLDLRLLPPLLLLWFFPFIDRINIGNARIQGLEKDLHMSGNQFNVALVVFFIPVILIEAPSNILMKSYSPGVWLGWSTVLLGIFTTCQGLVKNYSALLAMRFFVGLFEGVLIPGSIYLMAAYYPRFRLQWRINVLLVSTVVAQAFGGLLAFAIAGMNGIHGYLGWRWIFIIEGVITIAIGLVIAVTLPNWPDRASFLTPSDRELLQIQLAKDANLAAMDRLDRQAVQRCLLDWKIWIMFCVFFGTCATAYSISLFGPTFVRALYPEYTVRRVQILLVPVFAVTSVVSLISAYLSDRLRHRVGFALGGYLLSLVGFVLLLSEKYLSNGVKYAALYFVSTGAYITLPLAWTMLANNVSGKYKVACAVGLQVGLGNAGGIVTSLVFPSKDAPSYRTGFSVCLGLLVMAAALLCGFVAGLMVENRRREMGARDYRFQLPVDELANLGDDHPDFRFVY